jgi:hypothetical protein
MVELKQTSLSVWSISASRVADPKSYLAIQYFQKKFGSRSKNGRKMYLFKGVLIDLLCAILTSGSRDIGIRIRIRSIHMFLGILDPDLSVISTDPEPDPSIIKKKKYTLYEKVNCCFLVQPWSLPFFLRSTP